MVVMCCSLHESRDCMPSRASRHAVHPLHTKIFPNDHASSSASNCSVHRAGAFILIPDDNVALAVAKYGVAAVLGGSALLFFAGGFLLAALQEE